MEPTVELRKHRRHPVNFQGAYSSPSVQVKEAVFSNPEMSLNDGRRI